MSPWDRVTPTGRHRRARPVRALLFGFSLSTGGGVLLSSVSNLPDGVFWPVIVAIFTGGFLVSLYE